jgi:hypothetical protein
MNAKDIKSHIWITYQGADNSVWARIKNPYSFNEKEDRIRYRRIEQLSKANTFPILNTTEIGLEIQGEDLELVEQRCPNVEDTWPDGKFTRPVLLFTPKQTPKADSEKKVYKDASHYFMSSNVPMKEQDGISHHILALWSNIENWFGDPKKLETGRNFLLRIQSLYDIKLKGEDTGCLVANSFMKSKYFQPTPLSKVDNHIGETPYNDPDLKKIGRRYETGKIGFYDAMNEARQLTTQHPDPEMVAELNKYKTLYEELDAIVEPLQDKVIILEAEKGVMVDRILEWVAENAKLFSSQPHHVETKTVEHSGLKKQWVGNKSIDVDRDHIKSMRDDILNKWNDGKHI